MRRGRQSELSHRDGTDAKRSLLTSGIRSSAQVRQSEPESTSGGAERSSWHVPCLGADGLTTRRGWLWEPARKQLVGALPAAPGFAAPRMSAGVVSSCTCTNSVRSALGVPKSLGVTNAMIRPAGRAFVRQSTRPPSSTLLESTAGPKTAHAKSRQLGSVSVKDGPIFYHF